MSQYFAIDMGGTNIKLGIIDDAGEIIVKKSIPTQPEMGSQNILNRIEENIRKTLKENDFSLEDIEGIGVCCPGPMDPEKGIIFDMPNVPGWKDFPILDEMQKRFPGVKILVDNDANAAALGEWWIDCNRESSNLVFYTLGTGVGGGLILDGKLFHGSTGVAAELGHVTILPDGPFCGCGNRGCLEALASGTAIVRSAENMLKKFPESLLAKSEELTPEIIYNAAKQGDKLSKIIYNRIGIYLGIAIAGIINILNPDTVVLGGGIAAAHEFFLPALKDEVKERAFESHHQTAEIKISSLGSYAGLIGAAALIKFSS
jgi:glucokinase